MASTYGSLGVDVHANTKPLEQEVKSAAEKSGQQAGATIGEHLGRGMSRLGGVAGAVGKAAVTGLGLASGAALAFGVHAFKAASQVEAMNASLGALAKANHISMTAVTGNIDAMRRQGVAYGDAQQTVGDLVRNHISLSHATDLSRIAQNASAVTGRSYAQVETGLTRAISTGNAGALRRAGIVVDTTAKIKAFAAQQGISTTQVTLAQKQQITLNAVLAAGGHIAGAYAAQLKTPQGAMHLMKMTAEELTISVGTSLVHALTPAFTGFAKLGVAIQDATAPGGKLAPILGAIQTVVAKMAAPLGVMITKLSNWIAKLDPAKVKSFASEIVKIGPAIAGVGAAAAIFTGAKFADQIPVIGGMLGKLLGPIEKLGPALMNLAGPWKFLILGFGLLMAASPPFRREVMLIVTTLIKGLAPAFVEMGKSLLLLVPVITGLAKAIGPVLAVALGATLPLIYAFTDLVKFLSPALGPIVIGILAIVGAMKVWAAIQAILDIELAPFTLVLIGIVAVIAGVGFAVYEVVKHFQFFRRISLDVFHAVFDWLKRYWPLLVGIIAGPIGLAVVLVIKHWTAVRTFTVNTWRAISRFITGAVGDIADFLSGAWDAIKNAVLAAWRWIVRQTTNAWTGWGIIIRGVVRAVMGFLSDAWNTVTDAMRSAWRWVTSATANAWRAWGSIVRGAVSAVVGVVTSGFNTIRNVISSALSRATSAIRGWASSLLSLGRSAVSSLLRGITAAMAGIGSWVKAHVVDPIVNAVKGFFHISSPSQVMEGLGKNVGEGFIGGLVKSNPLGFAKHIFGSIPNALGGLLNKGIVSLGSLPAKALSALGSVSGWAKGALTKIGGFFGHLFGGGGGSGTGQWAGIMHAVLSHFGIPQLFSVFMQQMMTESGGNPRAINLWDSNAKAGIPSQGLMQVIPPTFAAYAGPYRSRGIMDPLANIYAAVAYALSRYGGSIGAVLGHGHGYAAGGILREPVAGFGLHSGQPYSFGEHAPAVPESWSPLHGGAPQLAKVQPTVINVYPQQGQSEVEIAAAVSRRLAWAAATGRA